jgi:hypothetical protein
VPYSTLTRFCRERGIGQKPLQRVGQYHFGPGEEMQHDTSPHKVLIAGRPVALQCASLVLCFSRLRYIQCYPRWNRFVARVFLTDALRRFDGSAATCMIDNSTVILEKGSGATAIVSEEMKLFSGRFGFEFKAHAIGHADRSARVERPFHEVETNFYAGRTFDSLADLNVQLLAWCDRYAERFHRSYRAIPKELFAIERQALKPLPGFIPEPTDLHIRRVDVEGYVTVHTNRYWVPEALIGEQVEVVESRDHMRVFVGPRLHAEHPRAEQGAGLRVSPPDRKHRWAERKPPPPSTEEAALRTTSPTLALLCDALRASHGGQALKTMRRLHRMWEDYPADALASAVDRAVEFGLVDLDRIERMVLRNIRGDFFRLPNPESSDG